MSPSVVVFDIGGVLVDWQPYLAWEHEMGEEETHAFLARIGFPGINLACDAGATFATAIAGLADAEDARRLSRYVPNYSRTLPAKIPGTWELLYALKAEAVPVHAITNWSAETWPEGLKAHPELGEVFDTLVVSGQEGVIKPSVEIYRLLCRRAGVQPEDCVFIDDGAHNVIGARAAGMDAIHFTGAEALKAALTERGLL